MYVVLLRFSDNKSLAPQFMDGHNAWIKQGFDDGVFLMAGSLQTPAGGTVFAHQCELAQLQDRVARDPFVAENVVQAEILEISPARTDDRLAFLLS